MKIRDSERLTAAAIAVLEDLAKPGKANKTRLRRLFCTPDILATVGTCYPERVRALRIALGNEKP